ncbi:L-arabinose transport system permease protein AraQ [Paenibacillus allorhizoplanae]|uniref:L-arabinose transport system permease protein AraQ n=1 Tax=Paenibacillus allorhizoplanae TaxID=2905648 RepID=A0ABN8GBR9_9BACL|nr:carbohydrate ABC transporter permease [Paenibacillus allorhizoplanae]CAH1200177.1 L-arabinose transport system permease protein AraQ [Paenibacillus allorhizoplanae]
MFDKRMKTGEKVFTVVNYTLLITVGLICVLPFITLLAKSVSEEAYVVSGQVSLWPMGFQLKAYQVLLSGIDFRTAFTNSLFVAVIGTAIQVFFTACVGYAIAKRDLVGRKAINILYVFTMLFNGGMIPTYMVIKNTGLINHLWVLVIPGMVSAFNLILVRNYFESLPYSLEESARIDGAGNLTILFRIMLPISKPLLATIAIFSAVGIWNNYMDPLMYLTKKEVQVLPLFLQNVVAAANKNGLENPDQLANIASETFRAAAIFVSSIPILLVYPFLQKYFVTGLTLGAVKQ